MAQQQQQQQQQTFHLQQQIQQQYQLQNYQSYPQHQYIPPPPQPHSHHHIPHPLNVLQPTHHHHNHLSYQYPANPNPYIPIPQYHSPNPNPPNYHHHHHRPSSKRPREPLPDTASDAGPTPKRQALGNDVLFRLVVPSSQIGKVIGKGGHRVQTVRDLTKATVKIADPISRHEERVIIISSKTNDGAVTDAEKALIEIASLILADDGSTAPTLSVGSAVAAADPYGAVSGLDSAAAATATAAAAAGGVSAGHLPTNSVKLLIAGSQAGGLIGVSGQNIEKLRNSSGATITVLAPNQLPLCTSAHDSDRLVQISGEVSAVLKAVEDIGGELRANPPNQVISISPTYNLSISRGAQSYMDPNAAEYVTLDMVISETMVGGLIGRSGSNIARIRSESGAMIKVFGGKGEQKHRQIQLIGTAQQVALAKQRVDEYIYSQLTQ